jgi:DUF4097 and DUF4098 domain-containing protein YvlB
MKRSFLTLLILTVIAAGSIDAEKYFFQYERELQTSGKAILILTNQIGQVTIRSHEGPTAVIKATKKIQVGKEKEANEILDNIDVRVEQSGDKITVTTNIGEVPEGKKSLWRKLLGGTEENPLLAVDYEITVPKQCELTVSNQSGSVTIDDVTGAVSLQTSSGSGSLSNITGAVTVTGSGGQMTLQQITGDVTVATSNGPVSATSITGNVSISASGKIAVQQIKGGVTIKSIGSEIRLASVEGPIDLGNSSGSTEGQLLFGPVVLKQESGKIDLQFVEGDIRIKSSSADIVLKQEKGSLDITTYTGSIDIQTALQSEKDYFVSTASGNINLRIPQQSSGHLQITSQAGAIKSDIPVIVDAWSKRELIGNFGSGGVKITLCSTTGDVTVAQF